MKKKKMEVLELIELIERYNFFAVFNSEEYPKANEVSEIKKETKEENEKVEFISVRKKVLDFLADKLDIGLRVNPLMGLSYVFFSNGLFSSCNIATKILKYLKNLSIKFISYNKKEISKETFDLISKLKNKSGILNSIIEIISSPLRFLIELLNVKS